jgi:hypothetical protein
MFEVQSIQHLEDNLPIGTRIETTLGLIQRRWQLYPLLHFSKAEFMSPSSAHSFHSCWCWTLIKEPGLYTIWSQVFFKFGLNSACITIQPLSLFHVDLLEGSPTHLNRVLCGPHGMHLSLWEPEPIKGVNKIVCHVSESVSLVGNSIWWKLRYQRKYWCTLKYNSFYLCFYNHYYEEQRFSGISKKPLRGNVHSSGQIQAYISSVLF